MASKSLSVIGPFVPRPTMTSAPSWPEAFNSWRIATPSDHWRLTAASTWIPGMSVSSGSW